VIGDNICLRLTASQTEKALLMRLFTANFIYSIVDSDLCDCEVIAYWRFCQLGRSFVKSGDYRDTPISKMLHFIWSAGLLKGWNRQGCTTDHWRWKCKGQSRPTLYTFIHSFSFIHRGQCMLLSESVNAFVQEDYLLVLICGAFLVVYFMAPLVSTLHSIKW
jgi:hypothetical protein